MAACSACAVRATYARSATHRRLYIAGTAAQRVALGLGVFAPDPSRARARVGLRMPTRLRRGGWVGFYGPRLIHTLPGEPRPPEKKKQLVLLPEVVGVK
jgi:hypothetical protein